MSKLILLLLCTAALLQARSNHARMRNLLYRIDKLMSPLKHRVHAVATFKAPTDGMSYWMQCGLHNDEHGPDEVQISSIILPDEPGTNLPSSMGRSIPNGYEPEQNHLSSSIAGASFHEANANNSWIQKCGLSEEVRFCRPECEPTCSNQRPTCSATCGTAVCMCQRGSVRQSGMCVPISACRFFSPEEEPSESKLEGVPVKAQNGRAPLAKAVRLKSITSETASVQHRLPSEAPPQKQQKSRTRTITKAAMTKLGTQMQLADLSRRRGSFAPPIFLPRSTNTGFQKDARGPAGPPSPPLTPPSRFLNRSPPSIMPLNRSPPSISPNNQQNIPFQRTNERPTGLTPPTTLPPRTTKHIPRPPSAVPPNFGPPGMTPFMFHEGRMVERNV